MNSIVNINKFSKEVGYKTNRILEIIKQYQDIKTFMFKEGRSFAIMRNDLIKFSNIIITHIRNFKETFMNLLNCKKDTNKNNDLIRFSSKKIPKKSYDDTDFHITQAFVKLEHKKPIHKQLNYGCTIKAYDVDLLTENKFEYDLLINKLQTIFSPDKRLDPKEFEYVKELIKIYDGKIFEDFTIERDEDLVGGIMTCPTNYYKEMSFIIEKVKFTKFRFSLSKIGIMLTYTYYTFDMLSCKGHLYLLEEKGVKYNKFVDNINFTDFDTLARMVRKNSLVGYNQNNERIEFIEKHTHKFEIPESIRHMPGVY